MDLEKRIQDVIKGYLESGEIESKIEGAIDKAIQNALSELTGWNGSLTKIFKNNMNEILIPTIESHDYSQYIIKLDSMLAEVIKQSALPHNDIMDKFKKLNIGYDKKEIKLEDILEEYAKYKAQSIDTDDLEYDEEGYYHPINCNVEVRDLEGVWNLKALVFTTEEEDEDELIVPLYSSRYIENKEYFINSALAYDLRSIASLNDFEIFLLNLERLRVRVTWERELGSVEMEVDGNHYD